MAPRKRQRKRNNEACLALAPPPTLPADILLEIAARSDATTLIRCAATCRFLRGHILTAALTQQQVFAGVMPQGILARLNPSSQKRPHHRHKPVVSLVHPATPAASYFVDKRLSPFVSRRAADLLSQYDPVTSRRSLVVLRRHCHLKRPKSSGSDLCVYDPLTDVRTFLSEPPDISMDEGIAAIRSCVLLTAADGIDCCPFLLLVARMSIHRTHGLDQGHTMRVQIAASSDAGDVNWGPVTQSVCQSGPFDWRKGLVVLPGGVIHWLTFDQKILTYDVRTGKSGIVKHPDLSPQQHVTMSSDGRLRILSVQGFTVAVWEQSSDGGWSWAHTIDMEKKVWSMHPDILVNGVELLELEYWEEIRSNAVLLRIHDRVIVLDLETNEMHEQEDSTLSCFFEVDLLTRLQAMRIFA